MVIRLASPNDLRACGEVYCEAFAAPPYREYWNPVDAADMLAEVLKKDPDSCWCAEADGRVVGFAFCTVFGKFRAFIDEFAVTPNLQKMGIGTALMQHVLDSFRERGVHNVDLVTNKHAPAFHFYQKFGFRQPRRYVLMVSDL